MSTTPTLRDAAQRDALLQAALDFISTLTGMTPPPIEVAPPEVFAPFFAFVDRVQEITAPAGAALTQGAGEAVEPVATVEALQARIAKLEAELDDMEAERDEALCGPWPEWAEQMKKTIRKHSGYDGFDDASEGIDLPAELDELMEHAVEPTAQQLQQAVARALAPIQQAIRDYHYALDTRQHGGVAQGKAVGAIEEALDMHWKRGEELAARAPKGPPCSA